MSRSTYRQTSQSRVAQNGRGEEGDARGVKSRDAGAVLGCSSRSVRFCERERRHTPFVLPERLVVALIVLVVRLHVGER